MCVPRAAPQRRCVVSAKYSITITILIKASNINLACFVMQKPCGAARRHSANANANATCSTVPPFPPCPPLRRHRHLQEETAADNGGGAARRAFLSHGVDWWWRGSDGDKNEGTERQVILAMSY